MKTLFTLLFLTILNIAISQNLAFTKNLKEGNIVELTNLLDENAEVSILEEESYTKVEAKPLLSDFFNDKTKSKYKSLHKGKSNSESFYQIGELVAGDVVYRTYIYSKNVDGNYLVKEFRIERQ